MTHKNDCLYFTVTVKSYFLDVAVSGGNYSHIMQMSYEYGSFNFKVSHIHGRAYS